MLASTPRETTDRRQSDWELLREKYGLNKKKKKKKGQPSMASTVEEAVADAEKKAARPKLEKEGFLISFRLSLAYRALERQELVASKPSLTPQKKFRRRQHRSKHRDTSAPKEPAPTEVEKARQKLKSNTQVSFWKQMISVRSVSKVKDPAKGKEKEKDAKGKNKSPRSSRPGTPKSARSSMTEPKDGSSLAVQEWERRKAVRKQEQHDKRQRLKSAKTQKKEKKGKGKGKDGDKAALLKDAAPVHIQRPASHRTPRDVTSAAAVITRPPSARSSPRGASSSARLASPSNTISASRPSSAHWSNKSSVSLFSDDKPDKQSPDPTPLPGAITATVDPVEVASTGAVTDASGAQSQLNVPSFGAKSARAPPLVSNYVRRLGSMKLLIPKPDPADLRVPKRRPTPRDTDTSSVADGTEQEEETEHRYRPCHYLYNMCNCQKVGRPKTISKLLSVRKISGVIKIFGCPEEPKKTAMVCPFCQTFPRQKVYAWLNDVDQEVELQHRC